MRSLVGSCYLDQTLFFFRLPFFKRFPYLNVVFLAP